MIDLVTPVKRFLKFDNVRTDNNVFRMHYKVTVIMLLVFTLLVTSKQFFGDPIHCMGNGEKESENTDAINSYCWIYGTYTLKSRLVGVPRYDIAYPGVGPERIEDEEELRHTYYQWVCFVLLGQAVMFYTPRYLWKIWEGGRLKALASNLACPTISKEWTECRRGELLSYLGYTNIYTHNMYALRYAICEILNLVNVIGQIFLLDLFLDGAFRNYGIDVATFFQMPRLPGEIINYVNNTNRTVTPMDIYFPKLTKCWFSNYGPSGTMQHKDKLCVLPLNIVNEKIFLIMWFWLIALAFISGLAVIFRVLVFSLPQLRIMMIMGQLRHVKKKSVSKIVRRFSFGDWFILYLLGKNMNPIMYKELILELSKENIKTVVV